MTGAQEYDRQHGGTNLGEIIKDESGESDRVVTFWFDGEHLIAMEKCDGYYGASINAEQLDLFIAWLTEQRERMS